MTDNGQKVIPAPSVCLMGPAGSGKTTSIPSLIEAGLEVFFIGTEPNALDALLDSMAKRNLPFDKLHWARVVPASPGWSAIEANITQVQKLDYESLSKMTGGIAKNQMTHLMDFIKILKNFKDERTGLDYGDVTDWTDSRVLVIDSLSGLNKMAREYVAGYSPTMHQGQWGVAMQLEENIIYKLVSDRKCFFVLIAHVDREIDEVQGGSRLTLAALGKKLAPQLVKYFSEVVLTRRDGDKFYWSTSESNTDVKNRALRISATLPPDFAPVVEAHKRRLATAAAPTT